MAEEVITPSAAERPVALFNSALETGVRAVVIASEEASSFVEALRTDYAVTLKGRAGWLADYLLEKSDADLAQIISDRIGRWTVEFLGGLGEAGAL